MMVVFLLYMLTGPLLVQDVCSCGIYLYCMATTMMKCCLPTVLVYVCHLLQALDMTWHYDRSTQSLFAPSNHQPIKQAPIDSPLASRKRRPARPHKRVGRAHVRALGSWPKTPTGTCPTRLAADPQSPRRPSETQSALPLPHTLVGRTRH